MSLAERDGAPGLTPVTVRMADLAGRLQEAIAHGARLALMTARHASGSGRPVLVTLLADPAHGQARLWETLVESADGFFPSVTTCVPQAHWFERAIHDLFGLRPVGHPRMKSVLLHEAWPQDFCPLRGDDAPGPEAPRRDYRFMKVKGEGVYEIPVGPIHAGIIEPGHFRFSCLGEVIQNLEIRLGYQHRGVEKRMTEIPWRRARSVVESANSDTAVGNALAHALAIESLFCVEAPEAARTLRAVALEIERVASHIGDLGGICNDIGFGGGSAIFARLRGRALGLGERLTGARFQTAYVVPGGVARPLPDALREDLLREVAGLSAEYAEAEPLLMDNAGALERMEGTGRVKPSLARDFGLVGPAGRASGVDYDVRRDLPQGQGALMHQPVILAEGDVLARVRVRAEETRASLPAIGSALASLDVHAPHRVTLPDALPANGVGVGFVEAWRGELVHLLFTDGEGGIARYAIKDPSFNNWTGLAIAARGELVADFPLCNKSFGLSYSGNDL